MICWRYPFPFGMECEWDLSYGISSDNVKDTFRADLRTCAQGYDVMEPNQTITEEAGTYYSYKIIQPSMLPVTLALSLYTKEDFSHDVNDTIQFNVNATQKSLFYLIN
jgi:hypothetical protein